MAVPIRLTLDATARAEVERRFDATDDAEPAVAAVRVVDEVKLRL